MSILTPTIIPFNTVDANEYFYVEYVGDPSSTEDNRFLKWRFVSTNIDTNTTVVLQNSAIYPMPNNFTDFEAYFYHRFVNTSVESNKTTPVGIWSPYTKNYAIGFPKDFVWNNQKVFENGYRYSIEIDFGVNTPNEVLTSPHPFSCYANFAVALESYQYNDGKENPVVQEDTTIPYELIVAKSFCKLKFSYTQEDNEQLKYYQFSLYNSDGVLLGMSKKTYGIPNTGIMYGIENYNNLQNYILKLYCVTQTDRSSITTVNIRTNYMQDNIYADISFLVDTQTAENNVSVSVVQLNGEGEKYTYNADSNAEYVIIPDDGYVTFKDNYQVITNNFLCRMWLKNLSKNIPILTINTSDNSGRVEVFFDGMNFIAKKYSCNLVAPYITCIKDISETDITSELSTDTNIYFAIGYYNGRIEMYARIIS